jgi:O-antigen ligase
VFLGCYWWPGETSAWASSVRITLLVFLIGYAISGRIVDGFNVGALSCALALFASWVLVSVLFLGGQPEILRRGFVLLVFICAVAVLRSDREDLMRRLLQVTVLVASIAALVTLYAQLEKSGLQFKYRAFRLHSSGVPGFAEFGNPIISGMYLAFAGLASLWCLLFSRTGRGKGVWAFCVLVIGIYVFLTFSRSAWLALGVGGLVLILLHPRRRYLLLLCSGLALLVSLLVLALFPDMLEVEFARGVTNRNLIWRMVLDNMAGYWWLGHGAGVEMSVMHIPGQTVVNTHSLYLEVLYQYGVVGLLLFLSSLALGLRQMWLDRSHIAMLGLALLLACMSVMFFELHSFIHSPNLIWLWVWFPLALALVSTQRQASP